MGIIAGLASIGRRVPEDVSVAGMDGHPLGAVCQPPLTTFRLGFERAGAAAFSMLVSDGAACLWQSKNYGSGRAKISGLTMTC
jgi:DNA-binding LacI/PurR family transcriptional regulator